MACLWTLIKSHFDYWWCFHNNIQGLRDGIEEMKRQNHYIEQEIERARLRPDILCPGVEEWLKASTKKLEEARKILLPDDNTPKAWNLLSRYSMGKNAKETAVEIVNLLNYGKFDLIACPAPPAAMTSRYYRQTMEFESRKSIEEAIIKSLKESSVDVIGICGMGGVGKTTMAQRIVKRLKEESLFDEVVMVTVSQKIDTLKIQEEIAEWLKLKLHESSKSVRARQLRTRLMDSRKKLLILDDVWERLEFEDLGIPVDSNFERCKVVLTSRSRDTCKGIKNTKVFELKILEEEEAWNLFRNKVGKCVEDSALRPIAKDVAAECAGLPIALVTVGVALHDEMSIYAWKNSLSQLRKSKGTDFPEVLHDVYNPLKLSYDMLDTDGDKCFFLLCCLFPEDYHIPVEELTWYSMSLQMFGDISIKEATNRAHTLVGKLKSRFLLIDGRDKLHVKMHDVVRDVAIYIGSRQKNGFLVSLPTTSIKKSFHFNCNWMSVQISKEQMEVHEMLRQSPKLRLLMLSSNAFYDISHISFEGMKDLNVLSFQSISIPSLPPTLGSLENLQTLCLFGCQVQNISFIGKLTSLKILSCYGCENIMELPAEIGSLSGLRLLELNRCHKLQRIPFGVISSLVGLEELKIRRSFRRWEAEENGKERRNASLTELECLHNLSCLEIEIVDCTLSAEEICLSQKLVKYYIRIGSDDYHSEERDYEKVMILDLPGAVGNWIWLLARNAEWLYLKGDGSASYNVNIAESENLRNLSIWNCLTLKKLVETKDCTFGIVFPLLETLTLGQLKNLEEICNQDVSFCNLKSINISQCYNLRSLFLVSVARRCLLQLEVLKIQYCVTMEQVFWNEIRNEITDDTDVCIEFPKLKQLSLVGLPNLTAFCQGLENIKFPNLTQMLIQKLPKLKYSVFSPCSETLCNLKSVEMTSCPKLKYLFSASEARTCLLQLEVLCIEDCESMEQVFWNEGTNKNTDGCIEFPKLKRLSLRNLPNLTAFYGLENINIKFPNLTEMWMEGLPKLNSLFPLNSETLVCHDENTCFHFVCNTKVEMSPLKDLTLSRFKDNISIIWCHQIPNNVFNNLEKLDITFMDGIRSLMSTSIAKNFVSLKYLHITGCGEMVEVIERDDDDEQVLDINCLFPTLKLLHIEYLDKLKRFWQWNHALKLPLLEEVCIYNCPVMETFILGYINTPNIREIEVNRRKMDDQKNLNVIISNIWTESQNMSDSEDDWIEEDGDEDANKD